MLVVYFGWALFRQESIADLGTSLKGMFGLNGNGFMDMATSIQIKNNIFLLIFCIIASTPLIKYIGRFFRGLVTESVRIRIRCMYMNGCTDCIADPVIYGVDRE